MQHCIQSFKRKRGKSERWRPRSGSGASALMPHTLVASSPHTHTHATTSVKRKLRAALVASSSHTHTHATTSVKRKLRTKLVARRNLRSCGETHLAGFPYIYTNVLVFSAVSGATCVPVERHISLTFRMSTQMCLCFQLCLAQPAFLWRDTFRWLSVCLHKCACVFSCV
jgi:hypothetical protein